MGLYYIGFNANNAKFICFNAKIKNICDMIPNLEVINNDLSLVNRLNNKKYVRNLLPSSYTVDFLWVDANNLDYDYLSNKLKSNKLVVQGITGSGGNNTYLVNNKDDLSIIKQDKGLYSVSKYIKNIPLNITCIVYNDGVIFLPISAQLIKITDKKFKYVGGDFKYIKELDKSIILNINKQSEFIINKVKEHNKNYRGIIGIDYILDRNDKLYFMEINPRFQSSTFLLNRKLLECENLDCAELHYNALIGKSFRNINLDMLEESFVNCSSSEDYADLKEYEIYDLGYYKDNPSSVYRKIYKRSIIDELNFENR